MCFGLSDNGPGSPVRWARHLRFQQMHRLPLLRLGVSLGGTHSGVGLACPENTEVHSLCGPLRPALSPEESKLYRENIVTPACVKACPADCLRFGTREEILQEAHNRISAHPDKYVDHIYGEKEAGGTSVLYLSSVPFEKLGFPDVGTKAYPGFSKMALHAVPPAVLAVGALLGGAYAFLKRRTSLMAKGRLEAPRPEHQDHHTEFESLPYKLFTPFNWILLAFMAFGGL